MEILLFRKAIIPQTTPDALLCGVEPDAEVFQLCSIHHKIPGPGVFFDPHMDAHCFGKLPGRAHHIPGIAAAKVVHTAGQFHGGFQVFNHLPHIGHAAVVVAGKAYALPF